MDIVKDKLLCEGQYADIQQTYEQIQLDYATIQQYHLDALRTWDKGEDPGEKPTSFTKIIQALERPFTVCFVLFRFFTKSSL